MTYTLPPVPSSTAAPSMAPPAASTKNTAMAKNTAKYTYVEIIPRRFETSKRAMASAAITPPRP
ncbi:MAG: hypothetical protein IT372_32830 [Polyangiaceae bacterium]|nr:hypothetical protein [Polyangiaceae bacterium]